LIRSAIRGRLKVAEVELATELRAVFSSGDDYASAAKPMIDWNDEAAREDLIDNRVSYACLDRVISTVDPEARHGHKTSARDFVCIPMIPDTQSGVFGHGASDTA
jgi:hypothetical protein